MVDHLVQAGPAAATPVAFAFRVPQATQKIRMGHSRCSDGGTIRTLHGGTTGFPFTRKILATFYAEVLSHSHGGWRGWVAHLYAELARLTTPRGKRAAQRLVKAEDLDSVPDSAFENPGEFPGLDRMLVQEMLNNAEAGCTSLYTRMKFLREGRLSNQQVVAGRECYLYCVKYFARATNSDTTYQWVDLGSVKVERVRLEKGRLEVLREVGHGLWPAYCTAATRPRAPELPPAGLEREGSHLCHVPQPSLT